MGRYFRMSRPNGNSIKYDIACQRTASGGARVLESYNGATGSFYGPEVHYIDRQPWTACRSGFALSRFRARNRGSNHIDYEYTCKRYDGYMNACDDRRTGSSNIGHQDIYYLDRYGLDCGNKVMVGFHARGSWGNVYYDYRCCQQNSPDPTLSLLHTRQLSLLQTRQLSLLLSQLKFLLLSPSPILHWNQPSLLQQNQLYQHLSRVSSP